MKYVNFSKLLCGSFGHIFGGHLDLVNRMYYYALHVHLLYDVYALRWTHVTHLIACLVILLLAVIVISSVLLFFEGLN